MAQLINLKLSRNDQSSPWGFRLQGGKDFGTPLLIQKVRTAIRFFVSIRLLCVDIAPWVCHSSDIVSSWGNLYTYRGFTFDCVVYSDRQPGAGRKFGLLKFIGKIIVIPRRHIPYARLIHLIIRLYLNITHYAICMHIILIKI